MALIMGMNSGSSFDGIDVVLAETEIAADGFPKAPKYLAGSSYKWPQKIERMVFNAFENKLDIYSLTRLNYMVGAVFADCARKFMDEKGIDPLNVTVIGLDGQTIYQEQPNHAGIKKMSDAEKSDFLYRWESGNYPCGLQIGESSVIANLLNIDTVTHFRAADHAFGGNAAPLMQYFDFCLFREREEPTLSLNIGGIANVHLTDSDRRNMYAFDSGPGNIALDSVARKLFNQPCDYDGKIAASGRVDESMLAYLMEHDFFERPIPRSGWREDFGPAYIDAMLGKYKDVAKEDIMATLSAFTAAAIIKGMNDYIPQEILAKARIMYASGGGVRNQQIMKELRMRLPQNIELTTSADLGIPIEFKEAMKFATIAYSTINHIADNIPPACYASHYALLGKVAFAPRHIKGAGPIRF
jgi:anhydro-N-acetylmuramic acid kinase